MVGKVGLPPLFEFASLPLMARKWSNQNLPGALHFVTGNFLNRIPVFSQETCCQSFIDAFATLLNEWPCKLIAYVLMPDHLHLIVNPQDGRIREFTGKLKSVYARAITKTARGIEFKIDAEGSSYQVWQEGFKAIPLWSAWMIWQKINYIHANPVKARLVFSARDYRWSSFQAFYSGNEKPLKVDPEWWWPDDSKKLSKAMKKLGWRTYEKRD
jgi:REP-associated tyrosine transposase